LEKKTAIAKIPTEAQEKKCKSKRVLKREYTVLKVNNYMPRTTDLEGNKTEDSCDP